MTGKEGRIPWVKEEEDTLLLDISWISYVNICIDFRKISTECLHIRFSVRLEASFKMRILHLHDLEIAIPTLKLRYFASI